MLSGGSVAVSIFSHFVGKTPNREISFFELEIVEESA
jgi:hypothetical protein